VVPAVTTGGYSPAQDATDQASTVNIVLTFDEHVAAGTGNVVLTPTTVTHSAQTAPTTVTIDVTDGTQVTFSQSNTNGVMTINPTNPLSTIGVQYTVTIANTCVRDTATTPNVYAGLAGTTYQFVIADTTVPNIVGYAPAVNGIAAVGTPSIVLTFDEHVQKGAGYIVIDKSDLALNNAIDVNDAAQVSAYSLPES